MRTTEANELINSVIESVEKSGINADKIISPLQAAREHALKENDPLVTRALRLAYAKGSRPYRKLLYSAFPYFSRK